MLHLDLHNETRDKAVTESEWELLLEFPYAWLHNVYE